MNTRVAAYALVTRNDCLLLCRLSAQVPQHQGKWTLPGGGIDFGEAPEQAVQREVLEETGLVVDVEQLLAVDSLVVGSADDQQHNIRIVYRASVRHGQLRHEVDGTTDRCDWWPSHNAPELVSLAALGWRMAFGTD